MTTGEVAAASGVDNVSHHLAQLVSSGEVMRLATATGALYAPMGTLPLTSHLTASQLRLIIGMPHKGCVRQANLPSGLRKELRPLLGLDMIEHVGLAAWKSVRLTDAGRAVAMPFVGNPKFVGCGMLEAYSPMTAYLIVLYDLLHPRDAGAYDVLMILGNTDLPPNNRTESAMMWLSRLGYLDRRRAKGRNHHYRATEKGRVLASSLVSELVIDNPADVLAARVACDERPRRVRATGSWPDIPVARVRIHAPGGDRVVPAIRFIAEEGDEAVRRDANDYGGVETVNYRHLENEVRSRCTKACTAAEMARASGVPVNSVLALLVRLCADGVVTALTEPGRPGRLYVSGPVDPAWATINRRLLDHMTALKAGTQPPRRVMDQLTAAGLAVLREGDPVLSEDGERALKALT